MKKKKIFFVFGTRPEVIKIYPVFKLFNDDPAYDAHLVSSGQQKELSRQMLDFFGLKPHINLDIMVPEQTLSYITIRILDEMEKIINENKPDLIFVQGDTSTAFIAGLAGFYHKIPIAHIEAGLRTFEKYSPYPEEANRAMLSTIAEFNFAPTKSAFDNLIQESRENIFVTGNTVVDALKYLEKKLDEDAETYDEEFNFINNWDNLVLLTLHRRELAGDKLKNVLSAIRDIAADKPEYSFVYPVHFNPNVRKNVFSALKDMPNIFLIDPVSYDSLVFLIKNSKFIVTDSGGIQEEAPSFKKPVIVVRDTTERQESIDAGIAFLTGYDPEVLKSKFYYLDDESNYKEIVSKIKNPYGDGKSSEKIKEIVDLHFSKK